MSRIVFDTCVFIAYNPDLPSGSLLSVVVIQELMAGAADASQLKDWAAIARNAEKEDRLLVPTTEDWLVAGRALNSLRGLKSKQKLPPAQVQRIIRDVLIARTVKRAGCLLITDNLADFKQIKKFCDVRTMSGQHFFA